MRLLICVTLGLAACSSGKVKTCGDDSDCPGGQRCGAGSLCEPIPTDGGGPSSEAPGPAPDLGDDSRPVGDQLVGPDAPLTPDLGAPDVGLPPDGLPSIPCGTVIGTPCSSQGYECGAVATCLLTAGGAKGVCTCGCTPDDPATTIDEDDCPGTGNRCGDVVLSGGTQASYCFKKCAPKLNANDCQGGLSCEPSSGAAVGLYDLALCLFYGCTVDADCPVVTAAACSTTSPTACPAGQTCLSVSGGSSDGYCAKAGKCDTVSGLCAAHGLGNPAAKVGDPCADDTQCAGSMRCLMQIDWSKYRKKSGQSCQGDTDCCSGSCQLGSCAAGLCTVDFRNGYCTVAGCAFASTLTGAACPSGSTCNRLYNGGMCQKTCSLASAATCRGNPSDLFGDYECRSWDYLTLGGVQVTTAPACDFGPAVDCAIFGAASTLDCTSLGDAFNSTNMSCRGLGNTIKTSAHDPTGYCLDDTASGTQLRSPLP